MPAPLAPTTPLGDSIRACRLDAGLTQTDLADKLGVKQSTVSFWEKGKWLPQAVQVLALNDLIGLDLDLYWEAVRTTGDAKTRYSLLSTVDLRRHLPQTPSTAVL